MSTMPKRLTKTLIALSLLLAAGLAQAMSQSEAVDKVRRETGGTVLSVRTEIQSDREVHLVRVLTQDGRVRTVRVDGDPAQGKKKRPRN